MKVWMNGRLVEEDAVGVSIWDRGLLFGDGLFETMLVQGGKAVQLKEHLARLCASARVLSFPVMTDNYLAKPVDAVLAANQTQDAALRVTLTRGHLGATSVFDVESTPSLFITLRGREQPRPEWHVISIPSPFRLGAELPRHKTLNYLPNLLARRAALAANADEALLVAEGRVLEGAMSNFFAVVDGILRTAPVADGVLPGIVRASVLDLAKQAGVKVEERAVLEDELAHATECFCTNSLIGVQPVTRIGSGKVGSGEVGKLTQSLHDGYERLIQSG